MGYTQSLYTKYTCIVEESDNVPSKCGYKLGVHNKMTAVYMWVLFLGYVYVCEAIYVVNFFF